MNFVEAIQLCNELNNVDVENIEYSSPPNDLQRKAMPKWKQVGKDEGKEQQKRL